MTDRSTRASGPHDLGFVEMAAAKTKSESPQQADEIDRSL